MKIRPMITACWIACLYVTVAAQDVAEPFGLKMGMTREELPLKGDGGTSFIFELASVPKPHPDFTIYGVKIAPKAGVCSVHAVSNIIETNVFGASLTAQFQKIRAQIDGVYGKSTLTDRLESGSIWKDPQYWMMGLLKKERTLMATWGVGGETKLKPTMNQIILNAGAEDDNKGRLAIVFFFDNRASCDDELAAAQRSVF